MRACIFQASEAAEDTVVPAHWKEKLSKMMRVPGLEGSLKTTVMSTGVV